MVTFNFLLLVGLLALAVWCTETGEQKYLGSPTKHDCEEHFIPFKTFLDQVRSATYEDYEDTRVHDEDAFTEIKDHILKMYEGVTGEVTSFVLEKDYADCILIKEQPSVYHFGISKIPKPPKISRHDDTAYGPGPGRFSNAESPLKLGLKDQFNNPISCPKDAIPMARLTLEKLTRFATLTDFFSKPPLQLPSERPDFSTEEVHVHAYGVQNVVNFGGNSFLDVWSPEGDFSISQHWYVSRNDQPVQTVEGGWVVNRLRHPESGLSRLFIFYTPDGYKSGCWNNDCGAFVQTNHNWYLDGTFSAYSTADGEQWGFRLQWKYYQGNWWLFLGGDPEAVGHYPGSIYNGGLLTQNANQIIYGGEVANYTGGLDFPQMGSGAFAESGFGEAAFQNTIFYIDKDEDDGVGVWADLNQVDEGKAVCYTIDLVDWPSGGDWGTYFYFGGPGGPSCPL